MKIFVVGQVEDIKWINNYELWSPKRFDQCLPDLVVFTSGERISRLLSDDTHSKYLVNEARDVYETAMYALFKMMGIPMLGVNRGAHLLHVLNGGTLAPVDEHCGLETHKIRLENDFMYVNSFHEQEMISSNKKDFKSIAMSFDFRKEAIYYPGNNCLCIQWNPELMSKTSKCIKVTNDLIAKYLMNGNR